MAALEILYRVDMEVVAVFRVPILILAEAGEEMELWAMEQPMAGGAVEAESALMVEAVLEEQRERQVEGWVVRAVQIQAVVVAAAVVVQVTLHRRQAVRVDQV